MRKLLLILIIFIVSCSCPEQKSDKILSDWMTLNIPKYIEYIDQDKELEEKEKEAIIKAAKEALALSKEKADDNEK